MTTKLTVGIIRKHGQPNYGSMGAECHLEIEIDCRHVDADQSGLSDQIRQAFAVCRHEVEHELHSGMPIGTAVLETVPARRNGQAGRGNDGHASKPNGRPTRSATDAQVRAIHAIASKANVRLASALNDEFGVSSPSQLTIRQASDLIESLKSRLPNE
jgi:hypothetical protein